jgi:hypothetical protein
VALPPATCKGMDIRQKSNLWATLTVIAFILWLLSVKMSSVIIGNWGLINGLSPLFFVSLGLVSISFVMTLRLDKVNAKLLMAQLLVLIVILYFTADLIEGTARGYNAWDKFGFAHYILVHGRLSSGLWYHEWPGLFILASQLINVLGVEPQTFLLVVPLASRLLLLPLLFMLFRSVLSSNKEAWIACWLFYSINFVDLNYFTSSNLGYILYVPLIFLIFKWLSVQRTQTLPGEGNVKNMAIMVVVFTVALLVSHATYSGFLMVQLVLLAIVARFSSPPLPESARRFVIIFIILLFSGILLVGMHYFQSTFMMYLKQAFSFDLIRQNILQATTATAFQNVKDVRNGFLLLLGLFCLGATYLIWRYRRDERWHLKLMYALLVGAAFVAGAVYLTGEIFTRAYLMSIIPLSWLATKGLNFRKLYPILFVVLLIAPVNHAITKYGMEDTAYVAPEDVAGAAFFFDNVPQGPRIIGAGIDTHNFYSGGYSFSYERIDPENPDLGFETSSEQPVYVWFTYGASRYAEKSLFQLELKASPEFYLIYEDEVAQSPDFNLVYSNDKMTIFFRND